MATIPALGGRLRGLLFLTKFGLLTALLGFLADSVGEQAVDMTGVAAAGFIKLLRIPAYYGGAFINIAGFDMDITTECTAMQYMAIFIAAVMASPNRTSKQKVAGCAMGAAVIFLFNIIRIAAIGLIGANAPYAVFDFVHTYLWQGLFVVFVFVLWLLWIKDFNPFRVESLVRVAFALVASVAAFTIIKLSLPHYVRFLTTVADILFRFLPLGKTVSLSASEGLVSYAYGGKECSYLIEFDIYYSVPFFAVIAFFTPRLRLHSLYRAAAGLTILVFLHSVYTVVGFFFADHFFKTLTVHSLWWYEKLIVIAAPILLGLWVTGQKKIGNTLPKTHATKRI